MLGVQSDPEFLESGEGCTNAQKSGLPSIVL